MASTKPRKIVILAFPGFQPLDVIGPAEVFAGADQLAGGGAYTVEVVAKTLRPLMNRAGGYGLVPKTTTGNVRGPMDTLVVAGGIGVAAAQEDRALIRWIRSAARRSRRVTSVCSGAFLLARAGLLQGRLATTFPGDQDRFAQMFPKLELRRGVSFVHDGPVLTSVGGARSYDAALYLVDHLFGEEVARSVAKGLVLPWPPGGAEEPLPALVVRYQQVPKK